MFAAPAALTASVLLCRRGQSTRCAGPRAVELDTRIDLRDAVGRITAPTLVLSSADDQIIPPHHQREPAAAIRQVDHLQVPGSHGLPAVRGPPARFFSIVTEDVDKQQAQGRI
ncbi:pimeloyl-ACP methyl ester carboxylesterase [Kitasatospora sp. GP30]|uniref:alpha/beta fold hydrolase n=1 Tax=Kitasatospora sp. GP30 TaxID=3035084 RepID=UPI0015D58C9E|nr:hypothetical protein [Kitasatospora sp. GP30]MDH6139472.1 pimeloyl-ACP methyl ester carboxylesterase [Kitasatospora sp. GP30]